MVYFYGKKSLRKKLLKQLMKHFLSQKGKERLLSMVEGRPDWCVSRQRVWGVPYQYLLIKKLKNLKRSKSY